MKSATVCPRLLGGQSYLPLILSSSYILCLWYTVENPFLESFKKGFSEVMPVNLLYNFDAQELEFLTAGTLEIDVDDWRAHTEYRNGMSEKTNSSHVMLCMIWFCLIDYRNVAPT